MRKLATIQRIDGLFPIEGKDRIEMARVLGWNVIVKKDEFQVGDNVVFIEIDSVLPERPEFDFLASKKYRIKTYKLGTAISQGICFPTSILPVHPDAFAVGDDVTGILGVKQYEPDMDDDKYVQKDIVKIKKKRNPLSRFRWFRQFFRHEKESSFPDFVKKTDEQRIQNVPQILHDEWIATEKVDGCSGTFALVRNNRFPLPPKYEYIICSRNRRLMERDNSIYWQVSDIYCIEQALRNLIGNREYVAIQGECIGPKIQGNKYKVTEPKFFAFNLIDPTGRKNSVQAKNILGTRGIDFVPIVDEHFRLPDTVDEMVKLADGASVIGDTPREGLVVRSQDGKKSFKAISNEFLLHYKL